MNFMEIDLIGGNGFIGKAINKVNKINKIRTWSHNSIDKDLNFDLYDQSSWGKLLNSSPKNVIFLSWPGLPNYMEMFHITKNLPYTVKLVEELNNSGLENLVVSGTCFEYGLKNGPLKEDDITDPINAYAIAKDSLRRTLNIFCKKNSIRFSWARIFYPFGYGQNPLSLLPSLERAIDSKEQFFSLGSGKNIRDYISCDDVANMLLNLLTITDASGIYNCGSGNPISIYELVSRKKNKLGSKIELRFDNSINRWYEPVAAWADMSKYRKLL